ncbi:hypothetical protein [Kitasatospora sp. NPDC089509]|uniref:hypothetical protein n=1 Tax=Kitasatospora sp. NPDC089509 TaxID=3364079 RepID=UPI0038107E0C
MSFPPVAPILSAPGATSTAPFFGSMLTAAVDAFGAAVEGAVVADAVAPAPAPRSALAAPLPLPPPLPPPHAAVSAIAPPTRPAATTLRIDLNAVPSLAPRGHDGPEP